MKFSEYYICEEVIKSIDELGYKKPTDIQYKSIPPILRREDVLAVAQTGTGKTAAFTIPILHYVHIHKINSSRKDGVKCIVLVPTHELAQQITSVFQNLGKYTAVKILGLYGGVDQDPQINRLKKGVDIVVATPGRMFDLIAQGHLQVHRVEVLILDEADHMLDLGFLGDIMDLVKKLPRKRQTLFFSATINSRIKNLAYKLINQKAFRIQISPKDPVAKNIEHSLAFIDMDDKRFFLERMINENPDSKMLVFVRTKVRAERVLKAMERVNITSLCIHSGKDQRQRDTVMRSFKNGTTKVLIATDVSARGIDIPDIDIVVNYDLPDRAENYVHRVGRTGRGNKKGQAISFCSENEKDILNEIESYLNKPIRILEVSKADKAETRLLANEASFDVQKLLDADEAFEKKKKKKKKR